MRAQLVAKAEKKGKIFIFLVVEKSFYERIIVEIIAALIVSRKVFP